MYHRPQFGGCGGRDRASDEWIESFCGDCNADDRRGPTGPTGAFIYEKTQQVRINAGFATNLKTIKHIYNHTKNAIAKGKTYRNGVFKLALLS